MRFKGYTDEDFTVRVPNTPVRGFEVTINPESFERTLGVKTEKDKTARSGNSSGHDAGLDSEKYSFDLIFDGTGVAGKKMTGKELNARFNLFLDVVYASRVSEDKKKKSNYVIISYCGEAFYCKLDSMTIHYQLFQPNGDPLRIKASCRFSSVEKPKPDDPNATKPKKKKEEKPIKNDTPNHDRLSVESTYEETLKSAQENDAVSVMACSCPREDMSRNYSGELNYTPAGGSQ